MGPSYSVGERVSTSEGPGTFEREVGSGECIVRLKKDGRRVVVPLETLTSKDVSATMPVEGMVTKSEGAEEDSTEDDDETDETDDKTIKQPETRKPGQRRNT